ncbi:diguanylate cyclase [Fervidicella metallireducens AeB]|uniref:Diguanylate cyclase n=2 Tax=Fervidicella TaxID=1403538 RepID=A0A017RUK9_9CLOT|nr:diguanylate cyclase [Fervidicella metallireducens AeB]
MVKDLFINTCICVTMLFIASQILKLTAMGSSIHISKKIITGVMSGILGIILMFFSVRVTPKAIIDLRHLSIIVSSVYLGGTSTFIGGIIIALFRVLYYGISRQSLIVGTITMLATIGSIFIGKFRVPKKLKWILLFFYNTCIFSVSIYFAMERISEVKIILVYYWIGSIISSFIIYYYSQYLYDTHSIIKILKEEATTDFLTGLNNTRSFDIVFNNVTNRAKENQEYLAVLMIDIDFFKKVNDTYGHSSGDLVLKELGEILDNSIGEYDFVARVGGEEFCILLRDCNREKAYYIAEKIRKEVQKHIFRVKNGTKIKITVSIGIAVYPDCCTDTEQLKEIADNQLYIAKHTGRNKVCVQAK